MCAMRSRHHGGNCRLNRYDIPRATALRRFGAALQSTREIQQALKGHLNPTRHDATEFVRRSSARRIKLMGLIFSEEPWQIEE